MFPIGLLAGHATTAVAAHASSLAESFKDIVHGFDSMKEFADDSGSDITPPAKEESFAEKVVDEAKTAGKGIEAKAEMSTGKATGDIAAKVVSAIKGVGESKSNSVNAVEHALEEKKKNAPKPEPKPDGKK